MEYGWEWFWSVIVSSVGGATLLGAAAYLMRSQLSHWLGKDLERIKAQHQRDLESYKVSLIAAAERAKASQDVQKAMAVLIAEKRFRAIDELHLAVNPMAKTFLTFVQLSSNLHQQQRAEDASKLHDAMGRLIYTPAAMHGCCRLYTYF